MTAACIVCGHDRLAPWLEAGDPLLGGDRRYTCLQCRRCGLGMIDPLPTPEELAASYPSDFDPYVKPHKTPRPLGWLERGLCAARYDWPSAQPAGGLARGLARLLAPWLELKLRPMPYRGQGRWLDVGCGGGARLHRWSHLEPAFQPHGLERDQGAVDRARELGFDVQRTDFPATGLEGGQYDVVTLNHVLEHIPDPMAALREIRRLLAPGGCAVIAVPNRAGVWAKWLGPDWVALDLPRHLYHFSPASLRRAAERTGFTVRWIRHEGTQGPWEVWKRKLIAGGWLPEGRSLRNSLLRAPARLATAFFDMVGGADQFAACLEPIDAAPDGPA
ncbi:MAG: class I SAM-dependent methyltransferase [Planctomycetota bacterium]